MTRTMTSASRKVLEALERAGFEAVAGKGGFWVRDHGFHNGFLTLAQARRMLGLTAPEKARRPPEPAWGDYAWIAAINQRSDDR